MNGHETSGLKQFDHIRSNRSPDVFTLSRCQTSTPPQPLPVHPTACAPAIPMPQLTDISIVIPLAAGESAWRGLLPALRVHAAGAQVVLSAVEGDPQSFADQPDGNLIVVSGPAGRARQLNRGITAASRQWLWLLHADSRIGADTVDALLRAPEQDYIGYFDLHFHDGGWPVRLNAWGAWLRSRMLSLPFGDQGFLLRASLFNALGGFDEQLDSGEDHALVWAAKRRGIPLRPLGARLSTSARKYVEHGWWKTTRKHAIGTVSQARRFARPRQ
jgi:hypothetical protein